MTLQYFSDQERGPAPRTQETVSPAAWGGIVAAVTSAVQNGSFGEDFAELCRDGAACVCGTDEQALSLALRAEIAGISWPLQTEVIEQVNWVSQKHPYAPDTLDALDFVQFCYRHVSFAIKSSYHPFFKHHHLSFDRGTGRALFRDQINRIFSRNGIAFDLHVDGNITRLAPPVLAELIRSPLRRTGDAILDQLFEDASKRFLSPDLRVRTESLEKLWDAWERLKTMKVPDNKRDSIGRLLDAAAVEPTFRARLNQEAVELTAIGNAFMIRHTEVGKVPIGNSTHVDYLFHRLFALMHLLVSTGLD